MVVRSPDSSLLVVAMPVCVLDMAGINIVGKLWCLLWGCPKPDAHTGKPNTTKLPSDWANGTVLKMEPQFPFPASGIWRLVWKKTPTIRFLILRRHRRACWVGSVDLWKKRYSPQLWLKLFEDGFTFASGRIECHFNNYELMERFRKHFNTLSTFQ